MSLPENETNKTVAIAASALAVGIAVPLLILFLIVGLWWWLAILIGPALAAALVRHRWKNSASYVLSKIGAKTVERESLPQCANLIEGLALRAGIPEPDFYLLDDPAVNLAPVVGSDLTAIVFTTGLVENLSRIQLEGVSAVALARVKSGDAEAATLGAALYGLPLVGSPLSALVTPLAAWSLSRLLHPDRDVDGDAAGMALTRYPPGLSSAYGVIGQSKTTPRTANAGSNHLWIMADSETKTLVPHSPIDWRIEVLTEL